MAAEILHQTFLQAKYGAAHTAEPMSVAEEFISATRDLITIAMRRLTECDVPFDEDGRQTGMFLPQRFRRFKPTFIVVDRHIKKSAGAQEDMTQGLEIWALGQVKKQKEPKFLFRLRLPRDPREVNNDTIAPLTNTSNPRGRFITSPAMLRRVVHALDRATYEGPYKG